MKQYDIEHFQKLINLYTPNNLHWRSKNNIDSNLYKFNRWLASLFVRAQNLLYQDYRNNFVETMDFDTLKKTAIEYKLPDDLFTADLIDTEEKLREAILLKNVLKQGLRRDQTKFNTVENIAKFLGATSCIIEYDSEYNYFDNWEFKDWDNDGNFGLALYGNNAVMSLINIIKLDINFKSSPNRLKFEKFIKRLSPATNRIYFDYSL
jgi:hypothetical protein